MPKIFSARPFVLLCCLLAAASLRGQVARVELVIDWPEWSGENQVNLRNAAGTTVATYCDPSNCNTGADDSYSATLDLGYLPAGTYSLLAYDTWGNEWDGGGDVTVRVSGVDVLTYSHPGGASSTSSNFTVTADASVATSSVTLEIDWPCWAGENLVRFYNPEGVMVGSYCHPTECLTGNNRSYATTIDLGCLANGSGYFLDGYDVAFDGWDCSGEVIVRSGGSTVRTFAVSGYYDVSSSFSVSGGGGACTPTCAADFSVSAPGTWSGNTTGAGDDIDVTGLDGPDHVYAVDLSCDGNWRFSLCGATYDTKIEVSDACGGAPLTGGYNDDACGVQSEVTLNGLSAGTVWVIVDGLNGAAGNYTLEVTEVTPPAIACPDNIAVGNETGSCTAYINYLPPWEDSTGFGNYSGGMIRFAPISGSGTTLNLADDELAGPFPLGFPFDFYGNPYSSFYVSSNGFLGFSPGSEGCCSGQLIPNATAPDNLIAFAWEDLNPSAGGTVQYFVQGSAPNRVLVLDFIDVPHYGGGNVVTSQVQLHESGGVIEIHTTEMNSDGGAHTMGLENADATSATFVVGRNRANWSAYNEAIQFVPPNNASVGCGAAFVSQVGGLGFSADFPVGVTTETYQIRDASGNTATCSFTVTVNDTEVPTAVACPDEPISAVGDQPDCGGAVVAFDVEFADNCVTGGLVGNLLSGYASGEVFPVGTTGVEFEYVDAGGNRGTCLFDVHVAASAEGLSSTLDPVMGCGSCSVSDGDSITVYDQTGAYIGALEDDPALPAALGAVTLCNLPAPVLSVNDDAGTPVPILERYWRVEAASVSPATFTLHFTEDEFDNLRGHPDAVGDYAVAALEDIGFTAYPVGEGPATGSVNGEAVSVVAIRDNGNGTLTAEINIDQDADVYAHAASPYGGPLPVELILFTGRRTDEGVLLEWATATEMNVSHFTVERSADGVDFRALDDVPATGESTELQRYAWLDAAPSDAMPYYRLRSVDRDGSEELSEVIHLRGGEASMPASMTLFPNPFARRATLRYHQAQAGRCTVEVHDLTGRRAGAWTAEGDAGLNQFTMDLAGQPAGAYLVRLTLPDGETVTRRAVKLR